MHKYRGTEHGQKYYRDDTKSVVFLRLLPQKAPDNANLRNLICWNLFKN